MDRRLGTSHTNIVIAMNCAITALIDHSQAPIADASADTKLHEQLKALTTDFRAFAAECDLPFKLSVTSRKL